MPYSRYIANIIIKVKLPFFFLLAAIALVSFSGSPAFAAGESLEETVEGCEDYIDKDHDKYIENGMVSPIYACFKDVIDAVRGDYVEKIMGPLKSFVLGIMTLAIAFFGIRLALGSFTGAAAQKEAMTLLLKMVFISFLVFQGGTVRYVELVEDAVTEVGNLLLTAVDIKQTVVTGASEANPTGKLGGVGDDPVSEEITERAGKLPAGTKMWVRMDDTINKLFGMSTSPAGLAVAGGGILGIALIVSLLIFVPPVGIWVLILVVSTIVSVVMAFAMSLYIYIMAFFALMILTAISPLVIPLFLFNQQWAKGIFEQWLQQLISYSLQPIILTAFLVITLSVFSNIALSTQAIIQSAVNDYHNKAQNMTTLDLLSPDTLQMDKDDPDLAGTGGVMQFAWKWSGAKYVFDTGAALLRKVKGYVTGHFTVDFLKWGWDTTKELMIHLALSTMMAMIMIGFLKRFASMVSDIVGDRTIPNLAGAIKTSNVGRSAATMAGDAGKAFSTRFSKR